MTGFWSVRNPWNLALATDEFGPGTADGNSNDGASNDACGPAAIENTAAAYESRQPTYDNIGHIRAEMIAHAEFTPGSGCRIENVAAEIPRRNYVASNLITDNGLLTEQQIHDALAQEKAVILIVTNAQALSGNEQNVHGHFVAVVAYGGDLPDGSVGKMLILNSDIAGQHGLATGQWTDFQTLSNAQPVGLVVMEPHPIAPPPPTVSDPVIVQLMIVLQQDMATAASAMAELQKTVASLTTAQTQDNG